MKRSEKLAQKLHKRRRDGIPLRVLQTLSPSLNVLCHQDL